MRAPARPRKRPLRHDPVAAAEGIDFKAITEATLDVILRCDMDGTATYVSPSIVSLIGRTAAEMTGQKHVDHIVPEDKPALLHTLEAHRAGRADGRATFRMIHRNGSTVWVEGSGRQIRDPATGEDFFVIVLRDIADRKALEAQLSLLALTHETAPPAAGFADRPGERGADKDRERPRASRSVN